MRKLMLVMSVMSMKAFSEDCMTSCRQDGRFGEKVLTCFYDVKPVCARNEPVCKSDSSRECVPLLVNLGSFEPTYNFVDLKAMVHYTGP